MLFHLPEIYLRKINNAPRKNEIIIINHVFSIEKLKIFKQINSINTTNKCNPTVKHIAQIVSPAPLKAPINETITASNKTYKHAILSIDTATGNAV